MVLEAAVPGGAATVGVQLPAYSGFGNEDTVPCSSGVRFGSDGRIYRLDSGGSIWQWTGKVWLNAGSASTYYLERAVIGGDALTTDAGDLQQMNSNLDFTLVATGVGISGAKATSITFSVCDDTAGSNEIVTRTYTLSAVALL